MSDVSRPFPVGLVGGKRLRFEDRRGSAREDGGGELRGRADSVCEFMPRHLAVLEGRDLQQMAPYSILTRAASRKAAMSKDSPIRVLPTPILIFPDHRGGKMLDS